jgi:hypothetical protein
VGDFENLRVGVLKDRFFPTEKAVWINWLGACPLWLPDQAGQPPEISATPLLHHASGVRHAKLTSAYE